MKEKHCYSYTGPVYIFDKMVVADWPCHTYAVSVGRAKANIEYQIKTKLGLVPNSKIRLPGKIVLVF
jgi:hypothetical protein